MDERLAGRRRMSDVATVLARCDGCRWDLCSVPPCLWLARPTSRSLAIGGAMALVGEALRIWAAGHLEKGREVTRSGPYRLTRHPLYLGSAIIGVGVAIAAARRERGDAHRGLSRLDDGLRPSDRGGGHAGGDSAISTTPTLESRAQPVDRPFSLARAHQEQGAPRDRRPGDCGGDLFAIKAVSDPLDTVYNGDVWRGRSNSSYRGGRLAQR